MPRRFNCCELNHPCPIFCPSLTCTCSNEVVNPTTSNVYGFFNNTAVGAVGVGSTLPLSEVLSSGVSESSGSVVLSAGNYTISYFASGTVPAGGTLGVALTLNGTRVSGSEIQTTQTAGQTVTLSQTIALSVQEDSTLTLVNTSGETATFTTASIFVQSL